MLPVDTPGRLAYYNNVTSRLSKVMLLGRMRRMATVNTIRALRQARGWTQFELALKVGVQPQSVYLWESGRRMPQVPQMRKLGELFGICSDEIVLEPASDPSTVTEYRA